jgi:nitrilase
MSRVAIAQTAPIVFDRDRTLELVADWTARAADEGADLVLFPEAFVSGYPKGLDFGARVGMRTPAGRDDYLRYWNSAVDVPGPAVDRLGAIAKRHRVHLVIGVIERGVGTMYCTVLFLAPDGALMGKHRKLMPTAAERLVWGFGDGSTMPVFDTPLGRLGAVICWENYMPAMRLHMYSKGIQIYCAPTADERETWVASMRHIAMEGRCFVLSANQFAKRKDFPDDYDTVQGDDPETVVSRGGSCIIDPFGKLLAGPQYEGSCLLTADLDLGDLARGKYDFDVVGHYARPDVFRLEVNERATPVVVTSGGPPAGDPTDDPSD